MGKKKWWHKYEPVWTWPDCVEWFCYTYGIRSYDELLVALEGIRAMEGKDCELARYVMKTGKGSMTRRKTVEACVERAARELQADDERRDMYQLLADCGVPFDSDGTPLGIG